MAKIIEKITNSSTKQNLKSKKKTIDNKKTSKKFPKGRYTETLKKYILSKGGSENINSLIAIDPSSGSTGQAGYAIFKDGQLVDSGTLKFNPKDKSTARRIADMAQHLYELIIAHDIKVMAIELLRGRMVTAQLFWSVGAFMAMAGYIDVIEVSIQIWKSQVDKGYVKSDVNDAVSIGQAVFKLKESL